MRISVVTVFALLLSGWQPAAAWVPVDCKDRMAEVRQLLGATGQPDVEVVWQDYVRTVREAKPGSSHFAPKPFPKDHSEIVEDFKYVYFEKLFDNQPWKKFPEEQAVYEALQQGEIRFEVQRVEVWEIRRCSSFRYSPHGFLLRLFHRQSGKEMARASLHHTGLLSLYSNWSEGPSRNLPSLSNLSATLRSKFGRSLEIRDPRYVTADGLVNCRGVEPCIAFKSQGKIYLFEDGERLYEVDPSKPRLSVTAWRERERRKGLRRLGEHAVETPTVSLGFEMAEARLVGGPTPK